MMQLTESLNEKAVFGRAKVASVQGMGGAGKSVVTAAFARACTTRRAFVDGIVWVNVGKAPDLIAGLWRIYGALVQSREAPPVAVSEAVERLAQVLEKKLVLVVLDDVWQVGDVEPFLTALGDRCHILMTTREARVARALGAREHAVDELSMDEALELLLQWAEQPRDWRPDAADTIVRECGRLPLAVAMAGAMLKGGPQRWENVLHKLRGADLEKLAERLPYYPYPNLLKAMAVSVEDLDKHARERYFDLAIFPEKVAIPEGVLHLLWRSSGLDKFAVQDLADLFVDRSLARRNESGDLMLHDLQRDYAQSRIRNLRARHAALVQAYAIEGQWADGPDDGYYFQNLAFHLAGAGRESALRELLMSPSWLARKLEIAGVNALIAD
jgi:hypothetical protein